VQMTLKEFLTNFGQALKEKVISSFHPLFNPGTMDTWDEAAEKKLEGLKRKCLPAQKRAVIALAKGFSVAEKRGLILCAEQGSGKTQQAIAVAHLQPKENYRVIVMCPPHLVRKWIREIEAILPTCKVVNLNGKGLKDLIRLRRSKKPTCPEFYVVGRERAKSHHRWRKGAFRQKHMDRKLCPKCGKEVSLELLNSRPQCSQCREPLYAADRDGVRRYAKAEFIKKHLRSVFNLCVIDEVHELKGGTTAQGQALADIACVSERTLALTGTLMGGFSTNLFYIFWRLMPRKMKEKMQAFRSPMGFAEAYGIVQRSYVKQTDSEYTVESIGRSRGTRTIVTEKPGVSTLILTDFLLEHTVFQRLSDVSEALPPYDEKVVEVGMSPDQEIAYKEFEFTLKSEVKKALARKDRSLLGALVNSLLAYPDGARRGEIVLHPRTKDLVAEGPPVDERILPKEEQLLKILASETLEGRRCLVYLEHTGTRDLIPDLMTRITEKGLKPFALRSTTVDTEKREEWVKSKLETGDFNVMIANPNLVKTGLDLLEFPTIIFFQTGYSIYTLRQASRRSWRIGQENPVRVYYLSYADTMQSIALSLIATKMETALAVEGDLSDKGLAALAEGANSMIIEMARVLTGEQEAPEMTDSWKELKKAEFSSDSFLDSAADVEEATTTTTTITSGDRTSTITYQKIIRGKVFPRKGYAVGIVNKHKFFFKDGKVLYNGKPCGSYDKKGVGEINKKPIQLVKSDGGFLLMEVVPAVSEAA